MKCVFLNYGPGVISGPGVWLRRMLPRLRGRGIDPMLIVCLTRESDEREIGDYRAAGVRVACIPAPHEDVPATARAIAHLVREERADVMVADHVLPGFLAGIVARPSGFPTVAVLRSDEMWYRNLGEMFLNGDANWRCAGAVAVSEHLFCQHGLNRRNVPHVMRCPSGVPIPTRVCAHKRAPFLMVYAGRFEQRQKRIHAVAEAFVQTTALVDGVEGELIGDGSECTAVEEFLLRASKGRVRCAGGLTPDGVLERFLSAQVFVLLSEFEGLSTALQEAMACGLVPIVRRTLSGCDEVVQHGKNGFIIEDDAGLSGVVRRLKEDPELWAGCSAASRKHAMKRFGIDACADAWAEFLGRVCGDRRDGAGQAAFSDAALDTVYTEYVLRSRVLYAGDVAHLVAHFRRADFCGLMQKLDDRRLDLATRIRLYYKTLAEWRQTASADALAAGRNLVGELEQGQPLDEQSSYWLASLHKRIGDESRAETLFRSLLRDVRSNALRAGCLYHLGEIHLRMRKAESGRELLRRCLESEPGHREARRLLTEIESLVAQNDCPGRHEPQPLTERDKWSFDGSEGRG